MKGISRNLIGGLALAVLSSIVVDQDEEIMMRHDVDENKYIELGKKYAEPLAHFGIANGTLIAPRWILTAAHVANHSRFPDSVRLGDRKYKIEETVFGPNYNGRPGAHKDIALVMIEEPITHIKPVKLYRKSDEVGQTVIFVGTGYAGHGDKGLAGETNRDRKVRGAENKITGIYRQRAITFTFDAPDSPDALPLEGISGPGDSGGPAFIVEGGEVFIAGVSSQQDLMNRPAEGMYGVVERYSRVSSYYDWIMETIKGGK